MLVEGDIMPFIDEDYVNIVPQDLLERGIRLREKLGSIISLGDLTM